MAIPDSPQWSAVTDVKAYPQPSVDKPIPPVGVASMALGPIDLGASNGNLNKRYWLTNQESGQVVIRGSLL